MCYRFLDVAFGGWFLRVCFLFGVVLVEFVCLWWI